VNLTQLCLELTKFGAEWVLWLLFGLSIVSVTIMIERFLFFAVRRVNSRRLTQQLRTNLEAGNVDGALQLVNRSKAIECVVVAAGLRELRRGTHAVSETMLSVKATERLRLERYLPVLGTLGANAPFIGLLGTVLGIIQAARHMPQTAKESAADAVMSGVFEALLATAVGLFVAIPAVVAYNFFQRRARAAVGRADALAHLLLSMLRPDQPRAATPPPPKTGQVTLER
jgi:biopolymer transport protein ExbB